MGGTGRTDGRTRYNTLCYLLISYSFNPTSMVGRSWIVQHTCPLSFVMLLRIEQLSMVGEGGGMIICRAYPDSAILNVFFDLYFSDERTIQIKL